MREGESDLSPENVASDIDMLTVREFPDMKRPKEYLGSGGRSGDRTLYNPESR